MQFGLSESQQILKDTARKFFAGESPIAAVRKAMETETTYDAALWTKLAEQGFITYAPQNPYFGDNRFRQLIRKAHPLGPELLGTLLVCHGDDDLAHALDHDGLLRRRSGARRRRVPIWNCTISSLARSTSSRMRRM